MTGIVDDSCNSVVEYTYDAWGKLLNTTDTSGANIGQINPFLYRGYYCDSETGLYYLNSRYYDPQTGRFINADDADILQAEDGSIIDTNLFTYSENNCVNNKDSGGNYTFHIPNLGSYDSGKNIFYFNQNAPQQYLGYCDAYDSEADRVGAYLTWNTTEFKYGGKWWRLELWKGMYSYGKAYGAEVGLYYNYDDGYMWSSATNNMLSMGLSLYDGNRWLFSNWGTAWWLTGFRYGYLRTARYLHEMVTITFNDPGMLTAFLKKAHGITVHYNNYSKVTFLW